MVFEIITVDGDAFTFKGQDAENAKKAISRAFANYDPKAVIEYGNNQRILTLRLDKVIATVETNPDSDSARHQQGGRA